MDFNAYLNLISSQKNLPLILFILTFLFLSFLEIKFSGYKEKTPRLLRWPNHFLLIFFNTVLFRVILPGFCLFAAMSAYGRQVGILNWVKVPDLFGIIFTLIFLDWALYYFHRVYHAIPWLWKIHRVHHSDLEVDVTTGLRFHPLEVLITTLFKAVVIYLLGAPVYGVFVFEIWMEISLLFNHSNIRIPVFLEKILSCIIITPDMHRVHHSVDPMETNSNYGFNFSWWDRLFMTYHAPLKTGHEKLGLKLFKDIRYLRFKSLLLQPFFDKKGHFELKNIIRETE